jgi:diguanylate cyclase (GGDEF)-like protein
MRLLLVEDDYPSAETLAQALVRIDDEYNITHVTSVASALSELHADAAFDCALVDLSLPDAQLLEAPATLCESFPDLVLIALTGETGSDLAAEIIRLGAQDFLQKGDQGAIAIDRSLRCALERHQRELCLKSAANTDELTGVLNRRGCKAILELRAEEHSRKRDGCLALLSLDLDGFKAINDTYGHATGDLVLRRCARRIRRSLRPGDRVARMGGDEFAIICDSVNNPVDLGLIAQKLIENVGAQYSLIGDKIHASASIGIACMPNDAQSIDQLIHRSDIALYEAKRSGKNRHVFYHASNEQEGARLAPIAPTGQESASQSISTEADLPHVSYVAHKLFNDLNVVALETDVIQLGIGQLDNLQVEESVARIREKCASMANTLRQLF